MAFVSHADTAPLVDSSREAINARYRFWVRDTDVSSWRQLDGSHTLSEMARMLRQKRFVEFALIDGSTRPL